MKKLHVLSLLLIALLMTGSLWAQTSGVLQGTVRDAQGGVIPGAEVVITEQSTNTATTTISNDAGLYRVPVAAGTYTLSVEVTGFKTAKIQNVQVSVGITTTQDVNLQLGDISESVIVEASQGLIERQEARVTSVIEGQQITELPFTSRDTLDLALTQAGTQTPGRARSSTVSGLPKGALNISIDGIRVQSNFLRSSDGFFTYIRPRIDAIETFSLTQAGQTAESGGEGAVQIAFTTRKGTNQYHGGAWWYHRNPVLNANYYFNNLAGVERERQLLNQVGLKVGGPIKQDKLFFFFTIDSFRLPQQVSRTATILTPDAANGLFTYNVQGGGTNTVDLLALAGGNGFRNTIDPVNQSLLTLLANSANQPGVGFNPALNPYTQSIRFNNNAKGERYFPTLRLDYNINDNWRWEGIWNYNYFNSDPDTLNGRDPAYPGAPQSGSQLSNRFQLTSAVHTTIGVNKTNEFRVGTVGGTVLFSPELAVDSALYPSITVGGQPARYRPDFSLVTDPLETESDSRRNSPQWQFMDNFNWNKGNHTFTMGAAFSQYDLWVSSPAGALLDVSFGVTSNDPADVLFSTDNFPGSTTTDRNNAEALFAMLTGRVSGAGSSIFVGDGGRDFTLLAPDVDRLRQREFGLYFQDSWRLKPSLTFNWGLRWQIETPYEDRNNKFSEASNGIAGIWGPSGAFNNFQPGNTPGQNTTLVQGSGKALYDTDYNNFAPNLGLAWNPTLNNGWMSKLFGSSPVFRAGYSISYVQEGLNAGLNVIGTGPGYFGTLNIDADQDFPAGTVFAADGLPAGSLDPVRAFDFPLDITTRFQGFSYDEFIPDLQAGYVQSWSLGIQRELNPSTVLEFRYVGNKGTKLWQQLNLTEVNVFENGFLDEFLLAQNNLAISQAMGAGNNFSNQGLPGQQPLPTFEAAFGSPTSGFFRSGSWWPLVRDGRVGDIASGLVNNFTRFTRMLNAGIPINHFLQNPFCSSCGYTDNSGWSTYNALQVEVRRRMSKGLLFQANYTWSNSISNIFSVASNVFQQPRTLRDLNFGFGASPFNIYHAFKANWIYELPFGTGRRWASGNGVINKLTEGWALAGIMRIQSGRNFQFDQGGRGTFNQNDSGVDFLVDRKDLQDSFGIRQTPTGQVFWFPADIIGSDGRANSSVIAQHTVPGTFGDYFFFEGPRFTRVDLTVSKKTFVREGVNVEFRAEFLNAFNNINFLFAGSAAAAGNGTPSIRSTTFGRITNAFRDTSTTNDLGGRMIQLVLRVNF